MMLKSSFASVTAAFRPCAGTKPKVLVISGCPSVGKTDLALRLATLLNGKVVLADSFKGYWQVNIDSAKVSECEAPSVKHHIQNVAYSDLDLIFSPKNFADLADRAILDIVSRGRVPVIVGASGLYLYYLLQGNCRSPDSTHESRAMIDRIVQEECKGDWDASLSRLQALDRGLAASLTRNDWNTLKIGLEICILSGRPVASFMRCNHFAENWRYDAKCLFLSMPRVKLFDHIDAQCEAIVEAGLFQDVIKLVKSGRFTEDSHVYRSMGYRLALKYLQETWNFPTYQNGQVLCPAVLKVPRNDLKTVFRDFLFTYQFRMRNTARKQLKRFKNEPGFQWLNLAPGGERLDVNEVAEVVAAWFREDKGNDRKEGSWLPPAWDGTSLKNLSPKEEEHLKMYWRKRKHNELSIYSDDSKVSELLADIEELLMS